ncbi:hypothetical protein D3C76_1682730 [compost metagenome]
MQNRAKNLTFELRERRYLDERGRHESPLQQIEFHLGLSLVNRTPLCSEAIDVINDVLFRLIVDYGPDVGGKCHGHT